ncbi:PREDICTED: probable tRNA (uracil-O(2)-)-methyltransferase isoform X2 [Priapulus caudatus]|nr:PREDICTED: probable tRNA (uracil-O(2)-)-methyltransferase isoform X2 [Priapulus caudatus]
MKFVYEDVAIAAYLLLIWKKERSIKGIQEKQSFIDLGCGNGLLVYILSNEGHQGLGLDVRRRKIWDMYGPETVLRESSIVPSDDCLFPEYDWIIGNHSDELTPWIPVIAARSSYKCCCFLLPCCAHDFDCKFVRRNSKMSQYRDYLSYVKEIGEICGFDMEEDIMRIPSTKRVCFVGQVRNYCETEQAAVSQRISDFISSRSKGRATSCRSTETSTVNPSDSKVSDISGGSSENGCGSASSQVGQWAEEFKARSSVEAVRNCTKLNREVIVSIVNVISQELLRRGTDTVQLEDGRMWNQGGSIPISDVATLFDKTTLKQLKNECGGLQTLLRNHNNVFTVRESNVRFSRGLSVSTTEPTRRKKKQKCCGSICDLPLLYKTKLCWFHIGHPDGCPLSSAQCRFAHGQEELMLRPEFDKKQ